MYKNYNEKFIKTNLNEYLRDKLNEGLIHTYPISLYEENLRNELNLNNVKYILNVNYQNETCKITIYDNFKIVNSIFNNLGYFISKYKVYKQNSNIFNYTNEKNFNKKIKKFNKLDIFYESKFDQIIDPKNIVYHATNIKNFPKINNVGLFPKSKSKMSYHPDRIYLSNNLISTINLIQRLKGYDNGDYIICEIDVSNFKQNNYDKSQTDVKFYLDPKFSDGFYIYNNIPKNRISFLHKIYSKNIIDFDSLNISKKEIKAFKNNILVYNKIINS